MLAVHVQAKKTPLTFEGAANAMRKALFRQLGGQPALPVLALALAKTAFETARWQSIWNDNWGNVKAAENYEGTYCCYACNEVLASGLKWFIPEGELDKKDGVVVGKVWLVPPGHPQTRFRVSARFATSRTARIERCYAYSSFSELGSSGVDAKRHVGSYFGRTFRGTRHGRRIAERDCDAAPGHRAASR